MQVILKKKHLTMMPKSSICKQLLCHGFWKVWWFGTFAASIQDRQGTRPHRAAGILGRVPERGIVMTKLCFLPRWRKAEPSKTNSSSIAAAAKEMTKIYTRLILLVKLKRFGMPSLSCSKTRHSL
jgi:hypothetical protein